MKFLTFAILFTVLAASQVTTPNPIVFPGVPSGICSPPNTSVNTSNGDFYTCSAGVWVKVGSSGGGTPGGSNTQIQINNAGVFGAISNVASGSLLASQGASSLPVFQTKPVYDVRDFGVIGNGIVDDTTAFQNAINAACGSTLGLFQGAMVTMPNFAQIRVSSTININSCGGLLLDGNSSTGQAGFGAIIIWAGGNGGTVFSINRTRDSIFRNFSVGVLNTSNVFNIAFDLDENAGSGILSHNLFQGIQIGMPGSVQNPNFIGFRIGQNAPGNTEQQVFQDILIGCGGGVLTNTSNGRGFLINGGGGNAQPFYIPISRLEIGGCSHGVELGGANTRQVIMDGGNYGSNFYSVYLIGGSDVVFENIVTTLDVSSSIFLNGYSGHLIVSNNGFTGGGAAVIDVTNASAGLKLTVENNNFGGDPMLAGSVLSGSYNSYMNIRGNSNFTTCPTQATASFGTFLHNIPTSGTCDNMNIGTSTAATFGFYSRIDSLQNSPPVRFGGSYQNSGTPTFTTDYWQWQDIIGSGTNGTSTLTLTHSGTSNATVPLDLTAASTVKMVAASATGNTTGKRFNVDNSTTITSGAFTIGSGWGSTASIAITVTTSKDPAYVITITTGGSGIAANPTLQITFADGTWTNVPVCHQIQTGGNDIFGDTTVTARSATAYTYQWAGTPTTGKTYEFTQTCTGT